MTSFEGARRFLRCTGWGDPVDREPMFVAQRSLLSLSLVALVTMTIPVPEATAAPTGVVVVIGGQNSCWETHGFRRLFDRVPERMRMVQDPGTARHVLQYVQDRTKEPLRWVYACYSYWGKLYFHSQHFPTVQSTHWTKLEPFFRLIERESEGRPVSLVGHSHGAWTAWKTVEQLDPSIPIRHVFTIDMISRQNAHVRTVTWATLRALVGLGPVPPGHNVQAPIEFDEAFRKRARARITGVWSAYHQIENRFLHSSAYDGEFLPDCQDRLALSHWEMHSPWDYFRQGSAHEKLKFDRRVWREFENALLSDFERS